MTIVYWKLVSLPISRSGSNASFTWGIGREREKKEEKKTSLFHDECVNEIRQKDRHEQDLNLRSRRNKITELNNSSLTQ